MVTGTIAYCVREDHDWPAFSSCLARLAQKNPDAYILQAIGTNIADQRNQAARQMRGDWLWFIDSDMVFGASTVSRLLDHNVDVVQPLVLMRHPPHDAILHTKTHEHRDAAPEGLPRLVEVHTLGAGGTLYRRPVFEAIPEPWFEGPLGIEDLAFAAKLKSAGFKMHCDMSTPVGHITPMIVWPDYGEDGEWRVRYQSMSGQNVILNTRSPVAV